MFAALVTGVPLQGQDQPQVQRSVSLDGQNVTLTAQSLVVAAGNINDARYSTPVSPAYNGVGSILINTAKGGFLCTGSLLADGKTVLTAAHCLTPNGNAPTSISVNFFPTGASSPITLTAASWTANPLYSGQVIDENDVAVLHLGAVAPSSISRYSLATTSPENNSFEFVGFGAKGSFGQGATLGLGLSLANRRQGNNLFDIYAGDPRWNGFWSDPMHPEELVNHVLLADFDNGTTGFNSNDAMCWIGRFSQFSLGTSECNAGQGLDEADSGGGDSGGPGFVDGKIASVTSFGLTFGQFNGTLFPDIDKALNSSFGEFAGFTDVVYQSAWITSQMDLTTLGPTVDGPFAPPIVTPEPESLVLLASGLVMIGGLAGWRRLS
jgi:hypothetical protein